MKTVTMYTEECSTKVIKTTSQTFQTEEIPLGKLRGILQDLYRDDAILADKEMNKWSLDVRHQNSAMRQT